MDMKKLIKPKGFLINSLLSIRRSCIENVLEVAIYSTVSSLEFFEMISSEWLSAYGHALVTNV